MKRKNKGIFSKPFERDFVGCEQDGFTMLCRTDDRNDRDNLFLHHACC